MRAGFAVASGIAIPSGTGVMETLHGPLIVVFGIAVALIGGLLCRCFARSSGRFGQCFAAVRVRACLRRSPMKLFLKRYEMSCSCAMQ